MPPRPRVRPRRREGAGFTPAAAAAVRPRMSAGAAKAAAFSSSARVNSFPPASDSLINVPFASMRLLSREFHGVCRTSREVFETIITGEHSRYPYRHPASADCLHGGTVFGCLIMHYRKSGKRRIARLPGTRQIRDVGL